MNHIIPEDKLKTTTLGDLTQSQIYSTSSLTFIPQRKALEDLILIHNAKKALSTFAGGGIIPSKGGIETVAITDVPMPASSVLQPSENEVWRVDLGMLTVVNGASAENTITMQLEDATGAASFIVSGTVASTATGQPFSGSRPFWLTESLFIRITSNKSDTSSVSIPVQYEAM